jgi:predicted transglutaminase-like cysteine proteinase
MTQALSERKWSTPRIFSRWFWKTGLFCAITAIVLNPNLRIACKQVLHTFGPESLIQSDFSAMQDINHELDQLARDSKARYSEPKIVERYVLKKIRYVTDYENWGNIEYWPTAEEVWSKRQEDCDGRAILAASILRARGYPSTKLVVGLQHMWIQVNENEKDPSKPSKMIALLNPERTLQLEMKGNPKAGHFLRLAKGLLQPTAFRETSAGLIKDIPAIRKAILISVLLLLCYHPCKSLRGLLPVLFAGFTSAYLLAEWSNAGAAGKIELLVGLVLLAASIAGALLMKRFGNTPQKSEALQVPVPLAS